jgi:trimethylamine:corrinoid methyltransferase-like protein
LELIREAGISGDFLTAAHTLAHYREVLSRPLLAVRERREAWQSSGARDFGEAVADRLRDVLASEPGDYLDTHQLAELGRIEEHGMRELAD